MTNGNEEISATQSNTLNWRTEALISLGLFVLALIPRAYDLDRFVTADEAKWVYRSAQFLAAFLQGDLAGTTVNLTPAVTTTWLGSIGLAIYYQLNQAALQMPFIDWLQSLPQFRAELNVLVMVRWPMVILTSLTVVLIYHLGRRLFSSPVALLAATLIALDPHTIALSRIIGHDAPVSMFMALALLLLLLTISPTGPTKPSRMLFVLSGIAAGLAILSKAPALFLLPFAGLLFLIKLWTDEFQWRRWLPPFLLWGVAAYVTFIVIWPAAWGDPVGRPWAVVENAFLSATDQVEASAEGFALVPDLGLLYYLVNGGFKLTPLVVIGSLITLFWLAHMLFGEKTTANGASLKTPILLLFGFVVFFTIFMTLGGKRSPRYILPIFTPLIFVASIGWLWGFQWLRQRFQNASGVRVAYFALLIIIALFTVAPHAPYYFTYFNPLLGGSRTAPHLVKLGWGEGMDRVGRFLQRTSSGSRVGTAYASTITPFFQGDVAGLDSDRLDYLILYKKQVQGGKAPLLPEVVDFYEQSGALFSVDLAGIRYADVYPGPAMQVTDGIVGAAQTATPFAFRTKTAYAQPGEDIAFDVLWALPLRTDNFERTLPVILSDQNGQSMTLNAEVSDLIYQNNSSALTQHTYTLPETITRGAYAVQLGQAQGKIEVRNFQSPPHLAQVSALFDNQISLIAYQFELTEDFIRVEVAWRAERDHLPDYTVFTQMLDLETDERLAGIDTQPQKGAWPTSRWVKNEVIVDEYFVAVPPGLEAGAFKIIVGLYQPETGQRLQLNNGQDYWLLPWTLIRE